MGEHAVDRVPSSFRQPLIIAAVTALAMTLLVVYVVANAGGDPLVLARIGTQFSEGDPAGTEGYDGQFVYYIAKDLEPSIVEPFLDVPAYRYQRILLPILARLFSFGEEQLIPWVLPAIGIIAQAAGTWALAILISSWGISPWYALIYGLWAGFSIAVRVDLPEPLAYGLVISAIWATLTGKKRLGWVLYGLAIFAKEVTIIFLIAQIIDDLRQKNWREVYGLSAVALLPYLLFQIWLWQVFGRPGIGSGGANATPFEWFPFAGLIKVGAFSLPLLLIYLLIFGPTVILPSLWGLFESVKRALRKEVNFFTISLFLNALAIVFLPFSTFREPGGLLRFSCGLILSVILFASFYRFERWLKYGFFSVALNAFLIE